MRGLDKCVWSSPTSVHPVGFLLDPTHVIGVSLEKDLTNVLATSLADKPSPLEAEPLQGLPGVPDPTTGPQELQFFTKDQFLEPFQVFNIKRPRIIVILKPLDTLQANGLDATRLREQIGEIRKLNRRFAEEGTKFRIFAGNEVDILKDGSLDFDDEMLGELDYVVASVHNAMTLSEKDMTDRIIKAVSHPAVTMLGHLTGRLLLRREPYAVNVPAVIDACADTGTIIELNANPWRLDMDWRWWKLATEKGVKCAINPDAHATAHLDFLWFGVKLARKGWLTREDVINTLDLSEMETFLKLDPVS